MFDPLQLSSVFRPNPRDLMLDRVLLPWLILLTALALGWDDWFSWDPFVASRSHLWLMIGAAMFSIGWMLPPEEVRQVLRRWPAVLAGTCTQYTAMPLLAVAMASLWNLGPADRVGVIMAGCVPGAMASNVLSLVARANVSFSVSLTTSATLLSPLVVPWCLGWWLRREISVSAWEVAQDLCWTVVGPLLLGYLAARVLDRFAPHWQRRLAETAAPWCARLTILWIIAVVAALNRERLLQWHGPLLGALLMLNLGGYLAGHGTGHALRLPAAMRRALTLEVGMQNAGLGTFMALEYFPDQPEAAIPTSFYTVGCMLTGTILARIWARRVYPPGTKEAESQASNDR